MKFNQNKWSDNLIESIQLDEAAVMDRHFNTVKKYLDRQGVQYTTFNKLMSKFFVLKNKDIKIGVDGVAIEVSKNSNNELITYLDRPLLDYKKLEKYI